MAFGEATAKQAKTGYGYQFWIEFLREGETSASTLDEAKPRFVEVQGMKTGALPSPNRPEIDCTTTMDKVKAFLLGTGSIDDITLEFNFYPGNYIHRDIMTNVLYDEDARWWRITGNGMDFTFLGTLKSANTSYGVDQITSMPLVLKVVDKPTIIWDDAIEIPPATPSPNPPSTEGDGNESGRSSAIRIPR